MLILVILYAIILGSLCIAFLQKDLIKLEKIKQRTLKILILTCNTILYCVLYNKVGMINFLFYSIFIILIIYLATYDALNKKITNKLNIMIGLLGVFRIITISLIYLDIMVAIKTIITLIVTFIIMYLIKAIFKDKIGGGDIKFVSLLPLFYNGIDIIYIIFISSILASCYGIYLVIIKNKSKDYEMSYGVFLSIASIIKLFI